MKLASTARPARCALSLVLAILIATPFPGIASELTLKDGRVYSGDYLLLPSMEDPQGKKMPANAPINNPIVAIDNGLTLTFFPKSYIQTGGVAQAPPTEPIEKFRIKQDVAQAGFAVSALGPIRKITDFDEHGRRTLTIQTGGQLMDIVQGITEITPKWIKVEALRVREGRKFTLEQRLATSSLSTAELFKILKRPQVLNPNKADLRLRLVRFLLQAERYKDARNELEEVKKKFPDKEKECDQALRAINQGYMRVALGELKTRIAAGQHSLAIALLEAFPTEDVAAETLQEATRIRDDYRQQYSSTEALLKRMHEEISALADSALRDRLLPIYEEIKSRVSYNTVDRLAAYKQFSDDANLAENEKITVEERLALAVSGWTVGAQFATRSLPTALSLFDTRGLVRSYMLEPAQPNRAAIIEKIKAQEGGTPEFVARLLELMPPPKDLPENVQGEAGLFELTTEGLAGKAPVPYTVQVPPEYDPNRRYPAIVTLHGGGTTPRQQIDWWCGAARNPANQARLGQATRHGYIVIAPAWTVDGQGAYQYGYEEHAAVLNSLRDACRHFSIDSDRVYLSGHSEGADAAWDIGLAHPDLWAGVVPIVGRADRWVKFEWQNAELVPMYFVTGSLDGRNGKENLAQFDRMLRSKDFCNVTIVQYIGRGHEHFSDDILNIFDWMGRYRRNFFPKEVVCRSARTGDFYFYWLEMDRNTFPESVAKDAAWPPAKGVKGVTNEASVTATNGILAKPAAKGVTIWLSPELVDFKNPIKVSMRKRSLPPMAPPIVPDLAVMLEDARTRADRQHPFWAKVELPEGRVNGKLDVRE